MPRLPVPAPLIGAVLKAFSFVLTATLAVFVLVNLFAYWYPRDTRPAARGHPVFNDRFKSVYEGIYGLPIADVRQIFAEAWVENGWIFEPYVQFREQPRRGRFVNVSPAGFRLNSATDRTAFDPTRSFPIFLFGGSTTFGYGVRDEDTVAAHLEALLRRSQPDLADRIAVYNFGRGYYGSGQEALLLKSLVQRGIVPKAVIFIDGVNEQFCPTYSANIAEVFKILQHDPSAQLREVLASLPVTRLVPASRRTDFAANALYVNRTLDGYAFECGCPPGQTCHMQLVKTYALNKQLVRTMAKEFGFDAYFVLQPVGGYRNRFVTSPDGLKRPEHSWYLWGLFEQHALNGEHDYSFTGILENYRGEAFVDLLHYTSGVNALIAQHLSRILAPSTAKAASVPAPTEQVESSIYVAADPATLVSYFTVPAKLVQWLARSARIDPVRGGAFHIEDAGGASLSATFEEFDPPRRFSLALPPDRATGRHGPAGRRVDISFVPHQGGTILRVVHTGLAPEAAPAFRSGWERALARLTLAVVGVRTATLPAAVAK
jgi:uncharacterized protein YndB with AHSA1/START domain